MFSINCSRLRELGGTTERSGKGVLTHRQCRAGLGQSLTFSERKPESYKTKVAYRAISFHNVWRNTVLHSTNGYYVLNPVPGARHGIADVKDNVLPSLRLGSWHHDGESWNLSKSIIL